MGTTELFAWLFITMLASAGIFYTIGFKEGRKDGFWRGRSAGLKVGADRRSVNG